MPQNHLACQSSFSTTTLLREDEILASLRALPADRRESILQSLGADVSDVRATAEEDNAVFEEIVVQPTTGQLTKYFAFTAVPFVGFGFADNFLMLIFGEQLELHLGSTLHLSTLAAAGLGNWLSDVAGLGLGGVIEAWAEKCGLPPHRMTQEQMELGRSKAVYALAAGLGITMGCGLGMVPLLWYDPDAHRLRVLFNQLDKDGSGDLDMDEVSEAFRKANVYMTMQELSVLFAEFDTEAPFGKLDFQEFQAMFKKRTSEMQANFMAAHNVEK